MNTPKVFISYSHVDEAWKNRVVKHLGVLNQDTIFELWDDRRIAVGDDWLPEIEKALQTCNVAVMLISADFLTSNFILKQEVPKLLDRRASKGVRVIPVILRSCAWSAVSWLNRIHAHPSDSKPLSSFRKDGADRALAALACEVAELLGFPGAASNRSVPATVGQPQSLCETTRDPCAVVSRRLPHSGLVNACLPSFSERVLFGTPEDCGKPYRVYYHCKEADHRGNKPVKTSTISGGYSGAALICRAIKRHHKDKSAVVEYEQLDELPAKKNVSSEVRAILDRPGNLFLLDAPIGGEGQHLNWITGWLLDYCRKKRHAPSIMSSFCLLSQRDAAKHPGEYKRLQWAHQEFFASDLVDYGVLIRMRNPLNPNHGFVLIMAGLHSSATHGGAEIVSNRRALSQLSALRDMCHCAIDPECDPLFEAVFSVARTIDWDGPRKVQWCVAKALSRHTW